MRERREYFPWPETRERLTAADDDATLRPTEDGRGFEGIDRSSGEIVRVRPPLVLGAPGGATLAGYLDSLPESLGAWLIFLLQAGAFAGGVWRDDRLLHHKVIRKYVTRGRGRAQPAYLKTKGKSRYGSRLRLRNARALLRETNERLGEWHELEGPFTRVFCSCPVRGLADLYATRPAPPFEKERLVKVPLDVRTPSFAELERVHRALSHGRVDRAPIPDPALPSSPGPEPGSAS